ncbi:putative inner membrane protein [Salmonella enterica subsp. enterica serovar Heidelberg str. 579083-19]|nr:putative inner membrane protein [Salmonella enterica subsp. enterica serovar Heidelberg str. 579083-19]
MSWQHFKQTWLIKFWAPAPAVIAAGILSTYYFGITGTFWAVTGEFTRWGGQILQLFGVHAEQWGYYKLIHLEGTPLTRIDGMMILGMFGGCFAAALWANNVKLRMPRSRIRIVQAVVGGMIAGFGARLAMGCNLAAFFTGIPQFSLHAWFFALATAIGSWFGARFTLLPIFRIPVKMQKGLRGFATDAETGSGKTAFQARYAGLYRHDWLGVINGNASAETGAGDAVRHRVWAADRARANLLYLGLSRSVDLRTRPYGESDYFWHGGQRHWYFQLRAVGRCT